MIRTSWMAAFSLILFFLAIPAAGIGYGALGSDSNEIAKPLLITAPSLMLLSIICAIVGIVNISGSKGALKGLGYAITAIVLSVLGLAAVGVFFLPWDRSVIEKGTFVFKLTVKDTFSISGKGMVGMGKIESGSVKVGDTIQLVSGGKKRAVNVISIEAFKTGLTEAKAGPEDVGICINVERGEINAGDVLSS